ncbi:MAG: hypothetical protein WBC44_08840 [Planctomycetaceae bacterium]
MNQPSQGNHSASRSESSDREADARLQNVRDSLIEVRLDSLGEDGAFLDRSGTGSGKTYACMQAAAEQLPQQSLFAVPSHRDAEALVREFRHLRRLPVVHFPKRTTKPSKKAVLCAYCGIDPPGPPESSCRHCCGTGSIKNFITCWNEEADLAEAAGLSVTIAVCQDCPFQKRCQSEGYLFLTHQAAESLIVVATHARLQFRGFAAVAKGRAYVSVQEDAIHILRPLENVDLAAVREFDKFFTDLFNDPRRLDWLYKQERDASGPAVDPFLRNMANISRAILEAADSLNERLHVVPLPGGVQRPPRIDWLLWTVAKEFKHIPRQHVLRVLLAAAEGRLHALVLFRDTMYGPGENLPAGEPTLRAVFKNERPAGTVWFSDATMEQWRLEAALGESLSQVVEPVWLPPQKRLVQVTKDVTISTGGKTVRAYVREALALFPERTRVGILCHQDHKAHLKKLEPQFLQRIVATEHFWGDAGRGSNEWIQNCDLLVVLGTPRLPALAIATGLTQLGEYAAACDDGCWGDKPWTAFTTEGREFPVFGRGYGHARWEAMHVALVRAALHQAIGRARTHLPDGIDAIVFSDEPLGLPTLDPNLLSNLSDSVGKVYSELGAMIASKSLLAIVALSDRSRTDWGGMDPARDATVQSVDLAERTGKSLRQIQLDLQQLKRAGIVAPTGQKGVWKLNDPWKPTIESSGNSERWNLSR